MKKIMLAILTVFMLSACNGNAETGFIASNVQNVLNKISNQESFLVLIEKKDCYSCQMFREDIQNAIEKNKLNIDTICDDDISDSDRDQLQIALRENRSWPVLFYVKEGSVSELAVYEYSLDPEGWEQWLIDMKLISK